MFWEFRDRPWTYATVTNASNIQYIYLNQLKCHTMWFSYDIKSISLTHEKSSYQAGEQTGQLLSIQNYRNVKFRYQQILMSKLMTAPAYWNQKKRRNDLATLSSFNCSSRTF
ncbi:hypothetical protein CEXT_262031 [Caerostris extrusa]|uniref:Uncharacterized protein n=1 Tax=Caerostris extrusa TaxID=172846 RepID=A0AAV4XRL9_CAEEX|nr:hypothetical protein CEXT_262031 [Caerostris extrusa]